MSKLLKQNGVNGKVIRSQVGGKVLKQNYNFGKCLNTGAAPFKITIPLNVEVGESFTIMFFAKSVIKPASGFFRFLEVRGLPLTMAFNHSILTQDIGGYFCNGSTPGFLGSAAVVMSYDADSNVFKCFKNNNDILEYVTDVTSAITSIDILSLSTQSLLIDDFYIFNRQLSNDELTYYNKNKLGNEILKTNGLTHRYSMDNFMLNDFGLGDTVAMPDMSGNHNHAPVTLLPAGTPTQQLNYANDNLFEQW